MHSRHSRSLLVLLLFPQLHPCAPLTPWISMLKHGPRRTFSAARASSVRDEVPQPDEVALLQKTAAALRRQADELELDVAPLRKAVNDILPIMPKVLEDSLWKIMFRVRPADDNRNGGRNVAGEVKLRLRGDGYTDILDAGGPVATGNGYIRKAWGWDIDLEPKDGKQYVVWSADATNMEGTVQTARYGITSIAILFSSVMIFERVTAGSLFAFIFSIVAIIWFRCGGAFWNPDLFQLPPRPK